jgi:hypothetical protein
MALALKRWVSLRSRLRGVLVTKAEAVVPRVDLTF